MHASYLPDGSVMKGLYVAGNNTASVMGHTILALAAPSRQLQYLASWARYTPPSTFGK